MSSGATPTSISAFLFLVRRNGLQYGELRLDRFPLKSGCNVCQAAAKSVPLAIENIDICGETLGERTSRIDEQAGSVSLGNSKASVSR
jgi:hypothetical protein